VGFAHPLSSEVRCYNVRMFERFTEAARRTIFFARREADRLGSNKIETEHLLLGIFADEFLVAQLLGPGVPREIRRQIEQHDSGKQKKSPDGEPPLSKESKMVLKLSANEADRLQDKYIGDEHLLLAILIERKCRAARLLVRNHVSLAALREQIARFRSDPSRMADANQSRFRRVDSTWTELGIPAGYAYPQLLFNPPTETMILQLEGVDDGIWRPKRLYMKHKDASKYEQIGSPDEVTSYESPVSSMKQPLLAFNVTTWQKEEQGVAGDWKELRVLDIKSGATKHFVEKGELILPQGFTNCWISDLLALSDDGTQIYVSAGLSLGEATAQSKITYVLAVLDLASKRLDPISVLRCTFF
jgi:ClpA/ClpB-like protein